MTKQVVRIEADAAFVHEGRSYVRGDRLDVSRDDALDLRALALAHIVEVVEAAQPAAATFEPVEEESSVGTDGDAPTAEGSEARPVRTTSRNRYLRRDRTSGET